MEDTALLFDVGREAVREEASGGFVEHDVGPLPAFHPVDRR
jgi:hypothetical protein